MVESTYRDGGLWALGGYLYQIIGVLGIRVRAQQLQESDTSPDELDILFDLFINSNEVPDLRVLFEEHGEDAMISAGLERSDGAVLVQFKYSRKEPPEKITKSRAEKIIDTFDNNVKRAAEAGVEVKQCVLITNREFSSGDNGGLAVWEAEEQKEDRSYRLRKVTNMSFEFFIGKLKDYLHEYGVSENKIEGQINCLIGGLTRTGSKVEHLYSEVNLRECIPGGLDAHKITVDCLAEKCSKRLYEFGKNQLGLDRWNFSPVMRRTYIEQLSGLISSSALVTVCGPGGVGKSVILWNLLKNSLRSIYHIELADWISPDWIPELVNQNWRNIPAGQCPNDSVDRALDRLRVANKNSGKHSPIIWLGLDGVDEASDNKKESARQIIRNFYDRERNLCGAPPDATLIVTTRLKENIYDLAGIMPDLISDIQIKGITVEPFDKDELDDAIRQAFPERIPKYAISPFDTGADSLAPSPAMRAPQTRYNIHSDVYELLKNPVIWRALLNVSKKEQDDVLDGREDALSGVAKNLLHWVSIKAKKRNPRLREMDIEFALSKLAKSTDDTNTFLKAKWIEIVRVLDGELSAVQLYSECVSDGLLEKNSAERWQWKYPFVHKYLLNYQG